MPENVSDPAQANSINDDLVNEGQSSIPTATDIIIDCEQAARHGPCSYKMYRQDITLGTGRALYTEQTSTERGYKPPCQNQEEE